MRIFNLDIDLDLDQINILTKLRSLVLDLDLDQACLDLESRSVFDKIHIQRNRFSSRSRL